MNAIEISLFTGVGGFSMAAEWAGWETYATCELEPNLRRTLEYYYPNAVHHDNVDTFTYESINARLSSKFGSDWRRGRKLVVTGDFPCQPYSVAGEMLGTEDPRHKWPEMLRVIREFKPDWVVGENVYGLVTWSKGVVFEQVQADLENEGYTVWPIVLPACGVGAPHRRYRVWFVAHRDNRDREKVGLSARREEYVDCDRRDGNYTYTTSERLEKPGQEGEWKFREEAEKGVYGRSKLVRVWTGPYSTIERLEGGEDERGGRKGREDRDERSPEFLRPDWEDFPTQQSVCDGNDGFPYDVLRSQILRDTGGTLSEKEVDKIISEAFSEWRKEGVKAMGNAIVPQVVLQIFETINEIERIGIDNLGGLDIFALKNT